MTLAHVISVTIVHTVATIVHTVATIAISAIAPATIVVAVFSRTNLNAPFVELIDRRSARIAHSTIIVYSSEAIRLAAIGAMVFATIFASRSILRARRASSSRCSVIPSVE